MKNFIGLAVVLACALGFYLSRDYQPRWPGPEVTCTASGWCKRVQQ